MPKCVRIEFPYRLDHSPVVGIDTMCAFIGVSRQVDLYDALVRNAIKVFQGIEIMIAAGDIDIVDVK